MLLQVDAAWAGVMERKEAELGNEGKRQSPTGIGVALLSDTPPVSLLSAHSLRSRSRLDDKITTAVTGGERECGDAIFCARVSARYAC